MQEETRHGGARQCSGKAIAFFSSQLGLLASVRSSGTVMAVIIDSRVLLSMFMLLLEGFKVV